MKDSALFQTLLCCSRQDHRRLRQWVQSPLVNQREDVIRLLDRLVFSIRKPLLYPLDREQVFEAVFPGIPFNDGLLRSVMHFSLNAVRQYLAYEAWSSDPGAVQYQLCRSLRRRRADKQFYTEWQAATRMLEQSPLRNSKYHRQQYQLQSELYAHEHRQRRSGPMNLQNMLDQLTHAYLADLLRQSCTILSYQNVNPQDYDFGLLDAALDRIQKGDETPPPAIALYHCAYWMLRLPEEEEWFPRLCTLIDLHWQCFPPTEMRDLYLLAINYCIGKLNRGKRRYIREALGLYRAALEKEVLLEDGLLSKFTYNNILMLAIAVEEWDWADVFLDTYKAYLPAREKENTYRYNRAVFWFRRPQYEKAMDLLLHVEFRDPLYNLNTRTMLLRIFYELQSYTALEAHLESFTIFLRRRSELGYHRDNYRNLIRFTKKLLELPPGDRKGRQVLYHEIENTAALAERDWLLEKAKV